MIVFWSAWALASRAFRAAARCSGVILDFAAFAASASCFIFACSSGVTVHSVLSSAEARIGSSDNVPAISITRILFMGLFLGCGDRYADGAIIAADGPFRI